MGHLSRGCVRGRKHRCQAHGLGRRVWGRGAGLGKTVVSKAGPEHESNRHMGRASGIEEQNPIAGCSLLWTQELNSLGLNPDSAT